MTLGIDNLGAVYQTLEPPPARARFVASTTVDPPTTVTGVDRVEFSESVLPPELHAEIDAAAERAADLASQNRELHFSKDEDSGRIIVQVRDLEGHVIRTIPNSEALHVIAGGELI